MNISKKQTITTHLYDWLKGSPVIILALVLTYTSYIGYVYEKTFFLEFNIDYLIYAEPSDFFFSWIRNEYVFNMILNLVLAITISILVYVFFRYTYIMNFKNESKKMSIIKKTGFPLLVKYEYEIYYFLSLILILIIAIYILVAIFYSKAMEPLFFASICLGLLILAIEISSRESPENNSRLEKTLSSYTGLLVLLSMSFVLNFSTMVQVKKSAKVYAEFIKKTESQGMNVFIANDSIPNLYLIGKVYDRMFFYSIKEKNVYSFLKSETKRIDYSVLKSETKRIDYKAAILSN